MRARRRVSVRTSLAKEQVPAYSWCMRRRTMTDGTPDIVPFEAELLGVALKLRAQGLSETHGAELARELEDGQKRRLIGYGTMSRGLRRLAERGFFESRWEDA